MESGGVHLYGSSTDGKTSAAKVGASVWGNPDEQVMSWNSTAYALPNEAATRNDGLLILDEAGQAAQGVIAKASYDLFNGKGKLQGTKDGGNRRANTWRVMVLSTGEKPIDVLVAESGQRLNAGQEVRLPSIPSDAGCFMGAIEQLHHHPSPEAFAKAITQAASHHYGSAGRAFLSHVQAMGREVLAVRLEAAIRTWCADLEQATGQAKRVARRFALMGESLELATEFGLTGWEPGEGNAAARRCFNDWLRRSGQTKHEDARIIEQAEAFFAAYGLNRFHRIRPGGLFEPSHGPSAAGYLQSKHDGSQYLVFPHVFEKEIAKGFDPAKVVAVLKAAGMLKTPAGRPSKTHRVPDDLDPRATKPKRLYEFVNTAATADDDDSGPDSEPDNSAPPPGDDSPGHGKPEPSTPKGGPLDAPMAAQAPHGHPPITPREGQHAQLPPAHAGGAATAGPPAERQHRDAGSGAPGLVAHYREGGAASPGGEGIRQEEGRDPDGHAGRGESHHPAGILPRPATERGGHHDGPDTPR